MLIKITCDGARFGQANLAAGSLAAGSPGRVTRDNGGVDVVVEFEQDVPVQYAGLNDSEAWVPRHFLRIEQ